MRRASRRVNGVELEGMYDAGYVFAGLSYTYLDTTCLLSCNGAGAHSYLPEHYGDRSRWRARSSTRS